MAATEAHQAAESFTLFAENGTDTGKSVLCKIIIIIIIIRRRQKRIVGGFFPLNDSKVTSRPLFREKKKWGRQNPMMFGQCAISGRKAKL